MPKILKIILCSVAALFLIAAVVLLFVNTRAAKMVENKINNSGNSSVAVSISSVRVNPFTLSLNVGGVSLSSGDFSYLVDKAIVNAKSKSLVLRGVSVNPKYGKYDFTHKSINHKDWMKLCVDEIVCSGVEIDSLFSSNKQLIVDSVYARNLKLEAFKNQKCNYKPFEKKLLFETLNSLKLPVFCRSLFVEKSSLKYSELPLEGSKEGDFLLSSVVITGNGISNIKNRGDKFTINLSGKLMGCGNLNVSSTMPVGKKSNSFVVKGNLGKMQMSALNEFLMPVAKLSISCGVINGLDFKILANSINSTSQVKLLYDSLKIDIYKLDDSGVKRSGFLSSLANSLVIKDCNPKPGKQVRIGYGSATRDVYKSQFNYIYKSILPAINEVIR